MMKEKKRLRPDNTEHSSKLVSVTKGGIPAYLHSSEFYRSLLNDEGDDSSGSFLVPEECMKRNDTVVSNEDLRFLLLTLRFWVADTVCDSVLVFALSRPLELYEDILSEFYQDIPILKHIKTITVTRIPMKGAVESGVISFVQYFLKLGHSWLDNSCALAVKAGGTAMLTFAIKSGCVVTSYATTVAAAKGQRFSMKMARFG